MGAAFNPRQSRIATDALYAAVLIKNNPLFDPDVVVGVAKEWQPNYNAAKRAAMEEDQDSDEDLDFDD